MTPHLLAQELDELSSEYATLSEEAAQIEMRKPVKWSEIKLSAKTNKEADMLYDASEDGQRLIWLKWKLDAYEKRMSAIKHVLRNAENEARNHF